MIPKFPYRTRVRQFQPGTFQYYGPRHHSGQQKKVELDSHSTFKAEIDAKNREESEVTVWVKTVCIPPTVDSQDSSQNDTVYFEFETESRFAVNHEEDEITVETLYNFYVDAFNNHVDSLNIRKQGIDGYIGKPVAPVFETNASQLQNTCDNWHTQIKNPNG